jgi:hypothetical protein
MRSVESIKSDHDRLPPLGNEPPIPVSDSSDGVKSSPGSPLVQNAEVPPIPVTNTPGPPVELNRYIPDPFTPCDSCGSTIPEELDVFQTCSLCREKWHSACVEQTSPKDLGEVWCCPRCVNVCGGRWDTEMYVLSVSITFSGHLIMGICVRIGKFILLSPQPTAPLFPAEILGRSSTFKVHLKWYDGNIYAKKDEAPSSNWTTRTPIECFNSYQKIHLFSLKKVSIIVLSLTASLNIIFIFILGGEYWNDWLANMAR